LDGYVADESGNFDWAAPDEELHAAINDLLRPVGTHLYGRRMYDVLVAWEDMAVEEEPDVIRDFASIWRAADKVVFSRTLDEPRSARTFVRREFEPDEIRQMKASAASDLSVGGHGLGGQAIRAGLVDELHLFVAPVIVGGGTAALPRDFRWDLRLVGERRFGSGFVQLHYRPTAAVGSQHG